MKEINEVTITELKGEERQPALNDLQVRNATFFTYAQLQKMMEIFGPDAEIASIQKVLAKQPIIQSRISNRKGK